MKQTILTGNKARKKILSASQKLSDLVGLTLGPCGRNVIVQNEHLTPLITNDGVTIARAVLLEDEAENLIAQTIIQASTQTNTNAGDGTTSAIVLACEIIKQGIKQVELGASPVILKEELAKFGSSAVNKITELAKPIAGEKEIMAIARNSSSSLEYGQIIVDAFKKVGTGGVVTIEENREGKTYIRHVEGCEVKTLFASPHMIENPAKLETLYTDAHLLLIDGELNALKEIMPALELAATKELCLVIVASDYSKQVTNAIILNRMRAGLKVVALKLDEMGNRQDALLNDLAALSGATLVGGHSGLRPESIQQEHLGKAQTIHCGRDSTKIIVEKSQNNSSLQERIEVIRTQIGAAEDEYTRTRLNERMARLTNGIAVISVGAPTEIELREKKLRIEDGVFAVKAAAKSGIIVGGGVAYLLAKPSGQSSTAHTIMTSALESIFRRICFNSDENPDIALDKVKGQENFHFGFDALAKKYCDLFAANIVDPATVIKQVIQNAISVASTLLTTDGIICATINHV